MANSGAIRSLGREGSGHEGGEKQPESVLVIVAVILPERLSPWKSCKQKWMKEGRNEYTHTYIHAYTLTYTYRQTDRCILQHSMIRRELTTRKASFPIMLFSSILGSSALIADKNFHKYTNTSQICPNQMHDHLAKLEQHSIIITLPHTMSGNSGSFCLFGTLC